jgi:signal transduction histidine kinase
MLIPGTRMLEQSSVKTPGGRFEHVMRSRRRQTLLRVVFASLMAAALGVFTGVLAAVIWIGVYVLLQIVEAQVLPRLDPKRAYQIAPTVLALNAAAFGAISWLAPMAGNPYALGGAAFCLTGAMLNAVVNTYASPKAFWCTATPYTVYGLGLPLLAVREGANWLDVTPLATSAGLLPILAWATAGSLRSFMTAKEQAMELADERRLEADAATQAKSRFTAIVGHELRTPLSAILAGSDALRSELSGHQRAKADLIHEAGRMMTALLDDLLDLQKVEAGRLDIEITEFDLRRMVRQTYDLWLDQARRKGLRLRLIGSKRLPRWIRADPTRLQQILNNLISNAIKFTESGEVALEFQVGPESDGVRRIEFHVIDTGGGMTAEESARLFQPFKQSGAHIARLHGGTGLGLAISRDLARLMGGDVVVESQPGNGSCCPQRQTVKTGSMCGT